jgi:3-deoxy-D-manno-octulosonic-acid transferase
VWKKPVFYGPYMDNFSDMKEFVEKIGLGFGVSGKDELLLSWKEALKMPRKFEEGLNRGEGNSVAMHAAKKQAMRVLEEIQFHFLPGQSPPY